MKQIWIASAFLLAGAATPALALSAADIGQGTQAPVPSMAATTTSGATFTLSPGWTQKSSPKLIELTSPEGDYRMALVEVGAAADAGAAAAQAWQLWARPTRARPS